jgi:hypothetical protein
LCFVSQAEALNGLAAKAALATGEIRKAVLQILNLKVGPQLVAAKVWRKGVVVMGRVFTVIEA